MVISRPKAKDVPFRYIADALTDLINDFNIKIEIELLRPPTFETFSKKIMKNEFDIVHFDGHGSFDQNEEMGYLIFEDNNHNPHFVSGIDLRQLLEKSKIDFFFLNACESAIEGEMPFSSIATSIISSGVRGVIAMSYSVYSDTAKMFLKEFFDKIQKNKNLIEAVTFGRKILFENKIKNSPIGEINLSDWMIPTLYVQSGGYMPFFDQIKTGIVHKKIDEFILQPNLNEIKRLSNQFKGRHSEFLELERLFYEKDSNIFQITGISGSGKSALALEFTNWYYRTNGCPGGMFITHFEEFTTIRNIILGFIEIESDITTFSENEQIDYIIKYLNRYACIIIWDNFQKLLDNRDKDQFSTLLSFAKRIKNTKSRLIITSKFNINELFDIDAHEFKINKLSENTSRLVANEILKLREITLKEDQSIEYNELIKNLNGHPRSLELIIPLVEEFKITDLINQINLIKPKNNLLNQIHELPYSKLSRTNQERMWIFSQFIQDVNIQRILDYFEFLTEDGRYRFIYSANFENTSWNQFLEISNRKGFISVSDNSIIIHPMLPAYLSSKIPTKTQESLKNSFTDFYASFCYSNYQNIVEGNFQIIINSLKDIHNIQKALQISLFTNNWKSLSKIIQFVNMLYRKTSRYDTQLNFLEKYVNILDFDIDNPPSDNYDKFSVWIFLFGNLSNIKLNQGLRAEAYLLLKKIEYALKKVKSDPEMNDIWLLETIATNYHNFGRYHEESRNFHKAKIAYNEALAIRKKLMNNIGVAKLYHQFGRIEEELFNLEEAYKFYKKAIKKFEEEDAEIEKIDTLNQIAMIYHKEKKFQNAVEWVNKSIEISNKFQLYEKIGISLN
ncbi:MAG: hypothetical protein HeimC2_32860, partial [Candidatus Heimdallarchaeota archaeon LC_2]